MNRKYANIVRICVLVICAVVLCGCAAGTNTVVNTPNVDGNIAGFWRGLWHGMISPITFIVSLFTSSVQFYEVHNNGGWYNFGFVLGAGILLGGGGSASSRRGD
jgi:hypothetical protein